MSTGRKLLFSLVTVLLMLGGAEAALRVMDWPPAPDAQDLIHRNVYWQVDPNLENEATLHKELGSTFSVSTDDNGLRPPHHGVEKSDGVFRVMTLGCSTTYGWGVDDDETYPYVLEQLLHDAGKTKVEVINGGQPGYTSFQGLWLWEKALAAYKPDLVLLGFVVQDARKAAYSDLSQAILTRESGFLQQSVLWSSRLYLGLMTATGRVMIEAKERKEGGEEGVYRVDERAYLENLRSLRSKIEANGGQAMHFGFPLEVEGYTEMHRRLMRIEAQSAGIPHFDPSAEITELARQETLFFPKDRGHANAAGNRRIAELVRDYLISEGLLGS